MKAWDIQDGPKNKDQTKIRHQIVNFHPIMMKPRQNASNIHSVKVIKFLSNCTFILEDLLLPRQVWKIIGEQFFFQKFCEFSNKYEYRRLGSYILVNPDKLTKPAQSNAGLIID